MNLNKNYFINNGNIINENFLFFKQHFFNNKKIVIFGTGSWATELLNNLLNNYNCKEIVLMSRNEFILTQKIKRFKPFSNVRFVMGDIRNKHNVKNILKNTDIVFHTSASKHVEICETNPLEAINTNILGTQNIIDECISQKIPNVILVSTDKASEPNNVYGATKLIAEKMFQQANLESEYTNFKVIRAGNVIGSNGSAIPLFIEQISKQGFINLTHKDMTRFFMSLTQAINLLINASVIGFGGEIIVTNMPRMKIYDLCIILLKNYLKDSVKLNKNARLFHLENKINIIGKRAGEKLHESLISINESDNLLELDKFYIIPSQLDKTNLENYLKLNVNKSELKELNSNTPDLLEFYEIEKLLINTNFLAH